MGFILHQVNVVHSVSRFAFPIGLDYLPLHFHMCAYLVHIIINLENVQAQFKNFQSFFRVEFLHVSNITHFLLVDAIFQPYDIGVWSLILSISIPSSVSTSYIQQTVTWPHRRPMSCLGCIYAPLESASYFSCSRSAYISKLETAWRFHQSISAQIFSIMSPIIHSTVSMKFKHSFKLHRIRNCCQYVQDNCFACYY